MSRWRYALVGALAAVALAVLGVAVVAPREHASSAGALHGGQLLAATAEISPQSHLFGESVHLRVDAVVDTRQLDPRRVLLLADWSPYQPAGPVVRTRSDVGSFSKLRWETDLHCIIVECAPDTAGSVARKPIKSSTISYVGRAKNGTSPKSIRIRWPVLNTLSRLDPIDLQRQAAVVTRSGGAIQIRAILPPWRVSSTTLAAASYERSPTTVFWSALALALALVVAAAAFARPWLPHIGRRRQVPQTGLERALAAVESARGSGVTEERKALELLADELRRSGQRRLAWTATELAWSSPAPEPERTGALASDVRNELERRTNGHRA